MTGPELEQLLADAVGLAEEAGPIANGYFRRRLDVHDKTRGAGFDPVTVADREVERFLRAELTRRYPGYGILGEEEGRQDADASRCWVVDPIDGTRAFITGMPAWGILLGLTENGTPRLGVMHQPHTGETFSGAPGLGATLRHQGKDVPLETRDGVRIGEAALYCTHPDLFDDAREREAFARVSRAARMTRFGGDCYAYCLLALGQVDLVIEASLEPYDIVPLIPIIEAAGGIVSDGRGGSAASGGFVVAAGSEALHEEALRLLALS